MDDIGDLIFIPVLIAFMGFFVISEFTIVKIRESKIDQFLVEGKRGAKSAKKIMARLEEFLLACQTAISIFAIAIGWLGITTIKALLTNYLVGFDLSTTMINALAIIIAFTIVAFLLVIFGELVPKFIAIDKFERLVLIIAAPLVFFYYIMYPIHWILNRTARAVTKVFGIQPSTEARRAHTEEELKMILMESFKSGNINQSEFKYVNNVFDFDDRVAREIMVPRKEIICLDINESKEELLSIIREEKLTRYPVIEDDKDHVLGLINVKELLTALISGKDLTKQTIESYIRPVIRVIDTIPIHELLVKMQREQIHMAVLLDEYGGTSGLVTVEDIVEELVGEIRDEFDLDEIPLIRQVSNGHYLLDSKVLISEVNELLSLNINDDDIDTIGGWILTEKFDIKEGDSIRFEDYEFHIIEMEEHHIKYIEVKLLQPEAQLVNQAFPIQAPNSEVV